MKWEVERGVGGLRVEGRRWRGRGEMWKVERERGVGGLGDGEVDRRMWREELEVEGRRRWEVEGERWQVEREKGVGVLLCTGGVVGQRRRGGIPNAKTVRCAYDE